MRSEQDVNRAVEEYSDLVFRLCMVLLKNDPTVTAEDVRQIPRETIRDLAQTIIIEDPCH